MSEIIVTQSKIITKIMYRCLVGVVLPKFFDPNLFLVFARVTTIASGFASNLCCDTKQARRSTAGIRIELLFGTFRTMRTSKIKLEMMFFESRFFVLNLNLL